MDVFPTDWSPRKTSLYFASGARDVPLVFLDDAVDAVSDTPLILPFMSNFDAKKFLLLLDVVVEEVF